MARKMEDGRVRFWEADVIHENLWADVGVDGGEDESVPDRSCNWIGNKRRGWVACRGRCSSWGRQWWQGGGSWVAEECANQSGGWSRFWFLHRASPVCGVKQGKGDEGRKTDVLASERKDIAVSVEKGRPGLVEDVRDVDGAVLCSCRTWEGWEVGKQRSRPVVGLVRMTRQMGPREVMDASGHDEAGETGDGESGSGWAGRRTWDRRAFGRGFWTRGQRRWRWRE